MAEGWFPSCVSIICKSQVEGNLIKIASPVYIYIYNIYGCVCIIMSISVFGCLRNTSVSVTMSMSASVNALTVSVQPLCMSLCTWTLLMWQVAATLTILMDNSPMWMN